MRHAWNSNAIFIISILTCRLCFHLDTVISVIFRSCVRLINSRVIKCLLPKSRINLDCQQFFAQIEARKLQLYLFVCLRMYCAFIFIPLEWMGLFIYVWFDKPADKNVSYENIVTFHWLECEARRVIDDIFKYILMYTFLREFMAVQCTAPSHVKYIYMCTCSSIVWTFRQIPI